MMLNNDNSPSDLPRVSPASVGVDPAALTRFFAALDATGVVHSAVVARHGSVVGEVNWWPYTATTPQTAFSIAKTFTALAVGFAVAEGKLSVADKVVDLFPHPEGFSPSANLAAMTVRDLLTMSSGHDGDLFQLTSRWVSQGVWRAEGDWAQNFFQFQYHISRELILFTTLGLLIGYRLLYNQLPARELLNT